MKNDSKDARNLRFAVIGTGFWARFQLAAWRELSGVTPVALFNRTVSKAEKLASEFSIPKVYGNIDELLDKEKLDFVDIISDVDTHAQFVHKSAERGIDIICQKPLAATLQDAETMVENCKQSGSRLFVHENFRWQRPIRALKEKIASGIIGDPFKARLSFCSAFPVFSNQPFLAELSRFILTDVGSHVLDVARFLFGDVESLYCLTQRVNPGIRGEDVANVLLKMKSGLHCYSEMSYASLLEQESFPQTLALVEGTKGSIHLKHNFEMTVSTREGTTTERISIPFYPWADPAYAVVHSSIVDCNRNILQGLQGQSGFDAETTGADNLKTVRCVWASYESAETGRVIKIQD